MPYIEKYAQSTTISKDNELPIYLNKLIRIIVPREVY